MSVYSKIKTIAETMTGYNVIVDNANGANIEFDSLTFPAILIVLQQSGSFNTNNSHYRDSANVRIMVLNKIDSDFKHDDIDAIKENLKSGLITLHHRLRYNLDFKISTTTLNYTIAYSEFDAGVMGYVFDDVLTERVGANLACDDIPQPQVFTVVIKDSDGNILQTFTTSGEYTVNPQIMIKQEAFTYDGNPINLSETPVIMLTAFAGASIIRESDDYSRNIKTITPNVGHPYIEIGTILYFTYTY